MSIESIHQAREEFERWYGELTLSLMDNRGRLAEELSVELEQSDFGIWLHEEGLQQYSDRPEMVDIERRYRELYRHINRAVKRQQSFMKPRLEYGRIEQTSGQLMVLLKQLEDALMDEMSAE